MITSLPVRPLLVCCLLLLSRPAPARADDDAPDEASGEHDPPPLGVTVRLRLWGGLIRGELQTPKGGQRFSTSRQRPTLEEVGLGGPHLIPEVELGLTLFGKHELHISDRLILISGRARLKEELISQAEVFPAGAEVTAGLDMQLVRLTYRPRWFEPEVAGWRFEPELGLALNTFLYTLRQPGADAHVHRGYMFASPYVGLLVRKQLTDELAFEGQVGGSAFVNGVTIAEGGVRLAWTPLVIDRVSFGAEVGLEGAWIRRKDGQPWEQNDPSLLLGGLTLGLRFDF